MADGDGAGAGAKAPASRMLASGDPPPLTGSSSDARRADRRAAVVMTSATMTAACSRARAARAHYTLKLGPRIYGPRRCLYLRPGGLCFPDPTSAGGSSPPSRAGGFLRRERPVVEERRRARAACDLEGNRAGLGCLRPRAPRKCFIVRSGHGVACPSVSTSPSMVTTSCLSSTGGWPIQPVRVYVGLK